MITDLTAVCDFEKFMKILDIEICKASVADGLTLSSLKGQVTSECFR
jgi:hypothetical protein